MVNLNKADLTLNHKTIVIAFSGGLDSVVLLHWLTRHYPAKNISAIHINHQLSNNANAWQQFCQKRCQQYQINFQSFTIKVSHKNREKDAREKRYQILKQHTPKNAYLCTAHHQQDQAETLLLQLLRGAGNLGLSAIQMQQKFGDGFLYRPLLKCTKKDIIAYAKQQQLTWVEDDSNQDTTLRRNFLRLNIFPQLEKIYPNAVKSLTRSAAHQQQSQQLLGQLAQIDIKTHQLLNKQRLVVSRLLKLTENRQKNILRYQIKQLALPLPSEKILQQIITTVLLAKQDSNPLVRWQNVETRRFKDELYLLNKNNHNETNDDLYKKFSQQIGFNVRFRQGGERCKLKGARHSRPLKKILQDKAIPPWQRDKLALYYVNDQWVAIAGVGELDNPR